MASKIDEELKDFDKFLSQFKDHPGYESMRNEFIKTRTEHPEWQKPSDWPIAKSFPHMDWDNLGFMMILAKHGASMKVDLWDRYQKSLTEGRSAEWEFVRSIIDELVQFRLIAQALHAEVDMIRNPPEGSRELIHAVK